MQRKYADPPPQFAYIGRWCGFFMSLRGVALDHGEVDISNNFAENAIRPFVVGRKGWLFCDSPKGADSSAIVYTLVETAKANGLDPYRYLERTLTELPYLGKNPKQEYLDAFMPWSSAMHRVCTLPAADHSAGVL